MDRDESFNVDRDLGGFEMAANGIKDRFLKKGVLIEDLDTGKDEIDRKETGTFLY